IRQIRAERRKPLEPSAKLDASHLAVDLRGRIKHLIGRMLNVGIPTRIKHVDRCRAAAVRMETVASVIEGPSREVVLLQRVGESDFTRAGVDGGNCIELEEMR